ncbi:hypothetical protein PTKIN_Ptkin14bG0004000 [Pterospermum kingtungense]
MGLILSCIFRLIERCLCRQHQEETEDPYKHHNLPISTPELLESFHYTHCSFKLHQNVISKSPEIVEENSQNQSSASAHVFGVDNLEETEDRGNGNQQKRRRRRRRRKRKNRGPERWVQHYCNSHNILLVGEGNFSFSASLAVSFGSATNMVATSLYSRGKIMHMSDVSLCLSAMSAPDVTVSMN